MLINNTTKTNNIILINNTNIKKIMLKKIKRNIVLKKGENHDHQRHVCINKILPIHNHNMGIQPWKKQGRHKVNAKSTAKLTAKLNKWDFPFYSKMATQTPS